MYTAVINTVHGGFGLSKEALKNLGMNNADSLKRNDPKLVRVVRKMGKEANGECADLRLVSVKPNRRYVVFDYDGLEWLAEDHVAYNIHTKRWGLASRQGNPTFAT